MHPSNPLFVQNSVRWCAIFMILVCTGLGLFERMELITLDFRYGLADTRARSDILLVAIDKDSIKQYDHWPWPRSYYAEVITTLKRGGAKIIGLDIDFSTLGTPPEDARLTQAVSAAGNVVLAAFHEDKMVGEDLIVSSDSLPFPELISSTAGMGSILFPVDSDGTIRRAKWADTLQGKTYLALAAEVARLALDLSKEEILSQPSDTVRFGDRVFSLQANGTYYIDFIAPDQTFSTISFADVLEERVDPEVFKDKIVLVGATAMELRDIWSAPFGLTPGLEIQANTLQTLLSGEIISRIPVWMTLLLVLGGALLMEASMIYR